MRDQDTKILEEAYMKSRNIKKEEPLFSVDPQIIFDIYDALKTDPEIGTQFRDLFVSATYFQNKIEQNMRDK